MKLLKMVSIVFLMVVQFANPSASDPIGYKDFAPVFIHNNFMLAFGSQGFDAENSKGISFKPFVGIDMNEKMEGHFGDLVHFSFPSDANAGAGDKPSLNFVSGFTFRTPLNENLEMFLSTETQNFKYQAHVAGFIGKNQRNQFAGVLKIGRKKMENAMFGRLDLRLRF